MKIGFRVDTEQTKFWLKELRRIPKYLSRVPWYYKPLWIVLSIIQICIAATLLIMAVFVFPSVYILCKMSNTVTEWLKFMCKGWRELING